MINDAIIVSSSKKSRFSVDHVNNLFNEKNNKMFIMSAH